MGISAYRLAKELRVPATRIAEIIHGKRSVTADTALRLARYFGTSAKFWLGLQDDFDLEEAGGNDSNALDSIRPYRGSETRSGSLA